MLIIKHQNQLNKWVVVYFPYKFVQGYLDNQFITPLGYLNPFTCLFTSPSRPSLLLSMALLAPSSLYKWVVVPWRG
jgi:hypothetical protein